MWYIIQSTKEAQRGIEEVENPSGFGSEGVHAGVGFDLAEFQWAGKLERKIQMKEMAWERKNHVSVFFFLLLEILI